MPLDSTAVYFPFVQLNNKSLLKESLFRWDAVDVLAPFHFGNPFDSGPYAKAYELIVRELAPSEDHKRATHDHILELLDSPLPEWLRKYPANRTASAIQRDSTIYARKFFYETWDRLREERLLNNWGAADNLIPHNAPDLAQHNVHPVLSHLMMATLARVCANGRATVTDQRFSYEQVFRAIALENRAREIRPTDDPEKVCQLTAAPVIRLNFDQIRIERLVSLRQRERDDSTGDYAKLRHSLSTRLAEASAELAKISEPNLRQKSLREFENSIAKDLSSLRAELRAVGREVALSVDMASLVAGVSIIGSDVFRSPLAVLPFYAAGRSLLRTLWGGRRQVLSRHFSAYLFVASQRRVENDLF